MSAAVVVAVAAVAVILDHCVPTPPQSTLYSTPPQN